MKTTHRSLRGAKKLSLSGNLKFLIASGSYARSAVVHSRPSLRLDSAEDSFRRGWKEAMTGKTISLAKLWENMDDD